MVVKMASRVRARSRVRVSRMVTDSYVYMLNILRMKTDFLCLKCGRVGGEGFVEWVGWPVARR